MTLRDQIAADLPTFLNVDEFGELRSIDGEYPVACVLDDVKRAQHTAEGVFISESLLHIRASDLPAVPVIGQRLTIDDRPCNVVHVDDEMGMLSIRVQWFES